MKKIVTAEQAAAVLEEKRRRRLAKTDLLDSAFHQQRKFIEDPCKLKAALCTRRAGKTYGVGLYIFKEAIQNPGCSILYLGLSYQSAKRIVMKDVFQVIAKKFGLDVKFNWSDLSLTFPNGSVVYISGADANEKQHAKLLGQKYRLAIIDEAAEWKTDLINLIYSTLKPAMVDHGGTIAMVGVPGNIMGFFYEVTSFQVDKVTGKLMYPGWKVHRWNAFDNPHIADKWEAEIEELKERNPLFLNTPIYKQQFLGEWVVDPDALCYKFSEKDNLIDALPEDPKKYDYVLGVDLGWNDPTAFVVCAYRTDENRLYVVHASKQKHMLPTDIAERVRELEAEFPINKWIIDGANLQLVQDLRIRMGIAFEAAVKGTSAMRKRDYIHLASADLLQRNIMVLDKGCDDLVAEWKKLVWDKTDKYNPREHQACDNHCADAFLYAYNACYAFVAKRVESNEPLRNSPEWVRQLEDNLVKRLSRKQDQLTELDALLDDPPR